MIQFKGELSKKTIRHICKCHKYTNLVIVLATIAAIGIPCNILFLFSPPVDSSELGIFWTLNLGLAAFLIIGLLWPFKFDYPDILPTEIIIMDNGLIVSTGKKFNHKRKINRVTLVKDYGDWYEILFSKKLFRGYFTCQKNLITKGSIKEFEELFEGKIEKVQNKPFKI